MNKPNIEIKVSGIHRLWLRRFLIVTSLPFVLLATVVLAVPEIFKAWIASCKSAYNQWSPGKDES